ncbi:SOS response-associated peptidase [Pleurocapsa sp. CCALA 161]|uniref:SOS response-associated peptidase n=1 Tax=Pleurocapsa sp. CCALA 161 TaxID=2107688 RepID=UPI0021014473|nr:SOS response-associated peptidase [Pleurocapsa sp. CCALA 161]
MNLDTTKSEIAKEFKCAEVAFNRSRFNIAPSQNITVVIKIGDNHEGVEMRWGLIPSWVKSLDTWKNNLINARVETIEQKPSFRDSFKKYPCLIPVSGFYEWDKKKQPYYFHQDKSLLARLTKYPQRGGRHELLGFPQKTRPWEPPRREASPLGQRIFVLAGIWSACTYPETDEKLLSCTILTTQAKGNITEIHHRMPVVIPPEYYDLWLENVGNRKELLEALPEIELQLYPVSKTVNSPKNDTPDCIVPIK